METIAGWARRAALTASARNRATNESSAARWGCSSFTATERVSTSSSASHTRAMPPDAMGRINR